MSHAYICTCTQTHNEFNKINKAISGLCKTKHVCRLKSITDNIKKKTASTRHLRF